MERIFLEQKYRIIRAHSVVATLKDYKAAYFEYKVLEKNHGQCNDDNLLTLFCQLKGNAQCVTWALGGGQMGISA